MKLHSTTLPLRRSVSDSATISVAKNESAPKTPVSAPSMKWLPSHRTHRVRFDTSNNQVHTIPSADETERSELWYTSTDFHNFREQMHWLADHLGKHDDGSWSNALLNVYMDFRVNQEFVRQNDDETVMMNENTIGLEALALPALGQDYLVRRRHLLNQVHRLQNNAPDLDENMRMDYLRETSRLTSQASKYLSHYIACQTARSVAIDERHES